ncbi:MAG TPA: hypothetical protein VHF24_02190 [Acidimicrobiales bacterium]|jgi:hypothetical protein|nr:hypothetical protein [Acidimicrobiales bacterium]
MRRTSAHRLAPILLVLVAVAGVLGTGHGGEGAAAAARNDTTAGWATTPGIEAVLPAKLETGFERSGLAGSSKQRPPLAVLVLPLVLACVVAARSMTATDVARPALLRSPTLPQRGPPLRRFAPT